MFIFPHRTLKDNIRSVILGLKAEIFWLLKQRGEICWFLKWRGRSTSHLSKPVSSPVCVLWPSHYFTKRVPTTEERYEWTLSDCIPTLHKYCRRLYFYISTSFSLFVPQFNMWHYGLLHMDHQCWLNCKDLHPSALCGY